MSRFTSELRLPGSTTSTGGSCDVPGPVACGDAPAGYPDAFAAYNDLALAVGPIHGYPERVPTGAAEVWLGPWDTDQTFGAIDVFLYTIPGQCEIPTTLKLAAWTEPLCGMPTDDPNLHAVEFPIGDVDVTPVAANITRVRYIPDEFEVAAGLPLYIAQILTTDAVCIAAIDRPGKIAPRALWWGVVDNDCDGQTDEELGHARLDAPTAPGVSSFPYDEAIRVLPVGSF